MALPKNRKGVLALLAIFNQRILGQTRPAMGCNCGAIHHGPATAVEIIPGGDEYPGQETNPVLWSVHMSEHPEVKGEYSYSYCLSEFIDYEELEQLFNEYLGGNRSEINPYRLDISGSARIDFHLGTAVRIKDNDRQTRFSFDWGADQVFAKKFSQVVSDAERKSGRRILHTQSGYRDIVELLRSISPEIYKGGPDPELPFESNWLLDYQSAITSAVKSANHIFIQNSGSMINQDGEFSLSMDVVFAKTK